MTHATRHLDEWTVTTWNLHGSERPELRRIVAAIVPEEPDIVMLQEVRRSQAVAIARALAMQVSWARKHYPYSPVLYRLAEGLAIMTPHQLGATGHRQLATGQPSSSWRRRIAQWAHVGRPSGAAVFAYNAHLSPHDTGASLRLAEAELLAGIIADKIDRSPTIVGGDFNDDRDARIIAALPGIEHVTPPFTTPAEAPSQLLDHVLLPIDAVDVAVTVPAGGTEWAQMSDHLPVTVRFRLPD